MAMKWEQVAIPLVGGIDTKSDAKTVLPTKLTELMNGEFTKAGSVRKRFGYVGVEPMLTTGVPIEGLLGVFNRDQELFAASLENLYKYDPNTGRLVDTGAYCPLTHTAVEAAYINYEQSAPDMASTNRVSVYAWEDSRGGVRCAVYNSETGAPYTADLSVSSTGIRPRCVALAANILILYVDTSIDAIYAKVIRTTDVVGSLGDAAVAVVDDLDSNRVYDAVGGGDVGYLIYSDDGVVGSGYRVCSFTAFGTATTFATMPVGFGIYTPAYAAINYDADTERVSTYIWESGGTTQFEVWDADLVAIDGEDEGETLVTNLAVATIGTDSSGWIRLAERSAGATSDYTIRHEGPGTVARHSGLASTPVTVGNFTYWLVTHESRSGVQNAYYLLRTDGTSTRVVGRVLSGEGVGLMAEGILPRLARVGDTLEVALPFRRRLDSRDTSGPVNAVGVFAHRGIKRVVFDLAATPRAVELGGTAYLTGSQLWAYDGVGAVEQGFHMFPDLLTADIAHNGTVDADISAGSYSYRVYYEWTLANGQRFRSAAITRTFTATLGQQIRLTIPTLWFTNKDARTPTSIAVYRAERDSQSGIHYRVSSLDPTATGTNGYVFNDVTADSVTFNDGMSDTALIGKEIDYISQGVVPFFSPEGPEYLAVAQARLWLAGGGQRPNNVRFSLLHEDGRPVEFTDFFEITDAPDYGGKTTAVSHVNESVLVFKERAIYALDGVGPSNVGGDGGYTVVPINTISGCTEPGSVLAHTDGVFFKSAEGIQLFQPGPSILYVGAEVEAYNAQTVVSALNVPDTDQLVFLTDDGRSLMFDTAYKQWSTYTNHVGLGATNWKGTTYVYLRTDGTLYVRDDSVYTDAGVSYPLRIRTAPLRLNDLQGFWRVRKLNVLGEYKSSHRLQVSVYYNRDEAPLEQFIFTPDDVLNLETWGDDATWGSGDVWGGPRDGRDYQFQHRFKRQKCQSVRLQFEDLTTGVTPGASFELTEIALEVGLKEGIARMPATRKF